MGIAIAIDILVLKIPVIEDALPSEHPRRTGSRTVHARAVAQVAGESRGHATKRHRPKLPPVIRIKLAERRLTQPHRLFEHRVEHCSEIAGRAVDDLQHIGGRGLLFRGPLASR